MTEFSVEEFSDYDIFAREWDQDDEKTTKMVWQLLGELGDEELLVSLPDWLAEEKVGYTEGATPTAFVGRIEEETDKAVRLAGATAARPLARLAHRVVSLRDGIEETESGDDRQSWLRDRLEDKQRQLRNREEMPQLREEWLPKSQIQLAVRRTD